MNSKGYNSGNINKKQGKNAKSITAISPVSQDIKEAGPRFHNA